MIVEMAEKRMDTSNADVDARIRYVKYEDRNTQPCGCASTVTPSSTLRTRAPSSRRRACDDESNKDGGILNRQNENEHVQHQQQQLQTFRDMFQRNNTHCVAADVCNFDCMEEYGGEKAMDKLSGGDFRRKDRGACSIAKDYCSGVPRDSGQNEFKNHCISGAICGKDINFDSNFSGDRRNEGKYNNNTSNPTTSGKVVCRQCSKGEGGYSFHRERCSICQDGGGTAEPFKCQVDPRSWSPCNRSRTAAWTGGTYSYNNPDKTSYSSCRSRTTVAYGTNVSPGPALQQQTFLSRSSSQESSGSASPPGQTGSDARDLPFQSSTRTGSRKQVSPPPRSYFRNSERVLSSEGTKPLRATTTAAQCKANDRPVSQSSLPYSRTATAPLPGMCFSRRDTPAPPPPPRRPTLIERYKQQLLSTRPKCSDEGAKATALCKRKDCPHCSLQPTGEAPPPNLRKENKDRFHFFGRDNLKPRRAKLDEGLSPLRCPEVDILPRFSASPTDRPSRRRDGGFYANDPQERKARNQNYNLYPGDARDSSGWCNSSPDTFQNPLPRYDDPPGPYKSPDTRRKLETYTSSIMSPSAWRATSFRSDDAPPPDIYDTVHFTTRQLSSIYCDAPHIRGRPCTCATDGMHPGLSMNTASPAPAQKLSLSSISRAPYYERSRRDLSSTNDNLDGAKDLPSAASCGDLRAAAASKNLSPANDDNYRATASSSGGDGDALRPRGDSKWEYDSRTTGKLAAPRRDDECHHNARGSWRQAKSSLARAAAAGGGRRGEGFQSILSTMAAGTGFDDPLTVVNDFHRPNDIDKVTPNDWSSSTLLDDPHRDTARQCGCSDLGAGPTELTSNFNGDGDIDGNGDGDGDGGEDPHVARDSWRHNDFERAARDASSRLAAAAGSASGSGSTRRKSWSRARAGSNDIEEERSVSASAAAAAAGHAVDNPPPLREAARSTDRPRPAPRPIRSSKAFEDPPHPPGAATTKFSAWRTPDPAPGLIAKEEFSPPPCHRALPPRAQEGDFSQSLCCSFDSKDVGYPVAAATSQQQQQQQQTASDASTPSCLHCCGVQSQSFETFRSHQRVGRPKPMHYDHVNCNASRSTSKKINCQMRPLPHFVESEGGTASGSETPPKLYRPYCPAT